MRQMDLSLGRCRRSLAPMLDKAASLLRAKLCEFALLASATAAVEFAMVLPVMLVAYIGSIEIGSGVTADHKLANLSLTLANLTALTTKALQDTDINAIFNASAAVLAPYDYTQAGMVISSIVFDGSNPPNAYVVWSNATGPGATALTPDCKTNLSTTLIPANLRTANGSVILGQAYFPYKPAMGYVVTGTISLADTNFMVPRYYTSVPRTNSSGTTVSTCVNGTLSALDFPAVG
ncbi:MAG: TadE/TadG family type IV pilus assembly protein [Beijerinckiaceae bacterium]|jgi:Flp pilus assembly protein TadG